MSRFLQRLGLGRFAVLIAFFSLGLIRGLFYSAVIPPWQAPDEPRHVEYAIQLAQKRRLLNREDMSLELQREILLSMKEFDFWARMGRDEPETIPESFFDDPFLIRSGTQFGDESPLYYLLPAFVFNFVPTESIVLRLLVMRWFSVLLSSATVVVSCLVALELFPRARFMKIAIPAFITFLPMFTFIGASANNDVLAVLIASLLIWQLVRVLRRGITWRSAFVICTLTFFSVLSKKTALFTVPLAMVAIPIHLWGRRVVIPDSYRFLGGVSCLLSTLLLAILLTWRGGDAAGWVQLQEPPGDSRSDLFARSGGYSMRVERGRLMQSLPFNTVREFRGKTVTLEAWVTSAGGDERGSLLVADNLARALRVFDVSEVWSRQSVTHTVSSQAKSIRVVLGPDERANAGRGALYFDDVSLVETAQQASTLLRNGSAEVAALRISPHLQGVTRYLALRQFADSRSYDLASLKRYALYILLTFAGFWANFGWLTLPLDPRWYVLLALVTMIASVGTTLRGVRVFQQYRQDPNVALTRNNKAILLLLVGLCLIFLQTFLPMIGRQWQPQGRYLFPGLVIIATFFSLGLREVIPRVRPNLLAGIYVSSFFLFDAMCVVRYIIPHYSTF